MASTEYRMKEELGPWEDSIVVREVWVLTSFVELGAAWDIAVWNAKTKHIPHKMPGELLKMVVMRLKKPVMKDRMHLIIPFTIMLSSFVMVIFSSHGF